MKSFNRLIKCVLVLIVTALPGILFGQYCGWGPSHVAVYHWKAKYGPVARYAASVADTSQSTGYIIILGRDSSGVYTIEGGSEDDARGGDYAYLAYSTYSGVRSIYPIYDGNMLEAYLETKEYDQKRKEIMLAKLWQYATEKNTCMEISGLCTIQYTGTKTNQPFYTFVTRKKIPC